MEYSYENFQRLQAEAERLRKSNIILLSLLEPEKSPYIKLKIHELIGVYTSEYNELRQCKGNEIG